MYDLYSLYERIIELISSIFKHTAAIVFVVAVIVLVFHSATKKGKRTALKTAYRNKAHGIVMGLAKGNLNKVAFSPSNDEGHVIAIGGTGTGKTQSILLPTITSILTGPDKVSLFVVDISGDILSNVKKYANDNVKVFSLLDKDTIPFNVFWRVDKLKDKRDQDEELEKICLMLIPPKEKPLDGAEEYYHKGGTDILKASMIALYHQGYDFCEICDEIVSSGWQELFGKIEQAHYKKASNLINQFAGGVDENIAGCRQSAAKAVELFVTKHKLKNSFRRPAKGEDYLSPPMIEKEHIFITLPDDELEDYADAMNLILSQYLLYFSRRPLRHKHKIIACIDEFSSFGRFDIKGTLRKSRKHGIRLLILTQAMEDLDLVYGQVERKVMMNNFSYKIILGASDPDSQEYFAKMIGYHYTIKHSTATNSNQTTHSEMEVREWVIEPSEFNHLGDKLIVIDDKGFSRLGKNLFHKYYK